MKVFTNSLQLLAMFLLVTLFSACKKEEPTPLTANVKVIPVVATGDVGGDVNGNGGSATKVHTWTNNRSTADYSMDMTASMGGSFAMTVKDAAGNLVLSHTLIKGQTPDSKSGVTASGTSGVWTVEITLTNFNGDGSFSLSQGN